ncbi:hypothetical protein OG244_17705 [Streptomyces brevispora]|uniref:hypothetical protein n=1 Tax=Streptomyces brevispora TaxID=887462 RepID=UPI002E380FBF|nr:hypothetical protein [Streptomyces brevispora]
MSVAEGYAPRIERSIIKHDESAILFDAVQSYMGPGKICSHETQHACVECSSGEVDATAEKFCSQPDRATETQEGFTELTTTESDDTSQVEFRCAKFYASRLDLSENKAHTRAQFELCANEVHQSAIEDRWLAFSVTEIDVDVLEYSAIEESFSCTEVAASEGYGALDEV